MKKFAVNYNDLELAIQPKAKIFRYNDVKHRLKKVAYDIVRFVDGDDISSLWQIQETEDGEVIVAKYDDSSNFSVEKTASVESNWNVLTDKIGNVHVFYKNSPVTKLSLASLGIKASDANDICNWLPEKLATNKKLSSNLLSELPSSSLKQLIKLHPELG